MINEIQQRYLVIQTFQQKWQDELKKLQSRCNHRGAKAVLKSNSGNYDPSANSYWIDFTCPHCGKQWQEEQ